MGFSIGSIFDPIKSAGDLLFGDVTGEDQAAAQAAENTATRESIERLAEQARGDVLNLFPAAEQARQQGTQAALDIFGQTIPQQFGALQQGNVGAQQALTQGLPQIIAALQGAPIDLSQIQPQRLDFDPSFAQQQLPSFQSTTSIFNPDPDGITEALDQGESFRDVRARTKAERLALRASTKEERQAEGLTKEERKEIRARTKAERQALRASTKLERLAARR